MNDPIVEIALGAYADEPCRICGKNLIREDINTAVFVGYSSDNKSRAAHLTCFQNTLSIFDELHRQLAECQKRVKEAEQERDRLMTALEAVEWDNDGFCLWCDGQRCQHEPDCPRQQALGGGSHDQLS